MTNDKHQETDIRAQNIGIVGDHAHVEGGIHFYGRPPDYHAPFQPPPLPPHFIPRPEVSDALKPRLLAEETAAPGVLVVSAIHGLGGIGKSVLAAALAHDPEIQARFPDGVLWATLGQQPDLLSLLSDWVQALGDYDFRPTTVEAASAHLRTLLHDQAALLVVDDVWHPEHALPFKTGGPRCQVLVTTRRTDVADEVGADLYQLDVMTPQQSLGLLAARLGRALEERERAKALRLAGALGYLPLALELAGARIARGVAWEALREALEEEIARLEALEGPRARRTGLKLEASFNLSLNALRAGDEQAWEAFVWLGVLPEDVTVIVPMATTLWEIDQEEAAETLELLWNDALLLPGSPVWIGEQRWPSYRLHDLLHDSARRLLTAPTEPRQVGDLPGLGLTLPQAHAHLLARYQVQTQDDLWYTLPDDGYIHAYLAWHLERAGWTDELHALLCEGTPAGRNGWYEARERLGQTAGFLSDLDRAWLLAQNASETEIQYGGLGVSAGLEVRYALVTASLTSLAANLPVSVLVLLVKRGLWSPDQGLAYASRVLDPERRMEAFTRLVPHMPEQLSKQTLVEALAAARAIKFGNRRAEALARLAPHLPERERESVYQEALQAVRQHWGASGQAAALANLGSCLPMTLLEEALAVAMGIEEEGGRAKALTGLIPYLPARLLRKALMATQGMEETDSRARVLAALVPHLPAGERENALREALAMACDSEKSWVRQEILSRLAPHLPEPEQEALWQEVLAIAEESGYWSVMKLMSLIPLLPERLSEQVLQKAQAAIQKLPPMETDERLRAKVMLIPYLPEAERESVCHYVLDRLMYASGRLQPELLADLAPFLSNELLPQALTQVQRIRSTYNKSRALASLAPHLAEPEQVGVLQEAIATAREIGDEVHRARILAGLTTYLPEPERGNVWRRVLDVAERIESVLKVIGSDDQAEAKAGLVRELAESGYCEEALMLMWKIGDEFYEAESLRSLAPHLPEGWLLDNALSSAWRIRDTRSRIHALLELASYLPESLVHQVVGKAQEMESAQDKGIVLGALYSRLAGLNRSQEALDASLKIEDQYSRAMALFKVSSHLTQTDREDVLGKALAVVQEIEDDKLKAPALTKLISVIPKSLLDDVLDAVEGLADSYWEARVALSYRLAELGLPQEALDIALSAEEYCMAHALARLGSQLPGPLLHKALERAQKIGKAKYRAEALAGLGPFLPKTLRGDVLQEAFAAGQEIEDVKDRAEFLVGLVPRLPEPEREQACQEALAAARAIEFGSPFGWDRPRALAELAPQLAQLSRKTLVHLWQRTLPVLANHTRQDMLADLGVLSSVLFALGGEQAIAETFRAIQDVGRWWP